MGRVLVVDDKEMMRDSVATTLVRKGHTVVTAGSARQALEKVAERPFDAVVTDLQMPETDGLEMLREIRRSDETLPVVLMTAYGTVETAVEAMKLGAFDYITKPFSGDELLVAVERAIEHARLVKENSILKAAAGPCAGTGKREAVQHVLIGGSELMSNVQQRLALIANSHGTVLISGESGSGKEVAARWIHEHSPRKDMPFLALNCAALSTSLLESELFGHEKGAFTGADRLRKGRFELADGGTLLLDEISEIAPEIQAKLLRVLQERTFERVGSSTGRGVDVRVIATTNRDLPAEVARGQFRQDLYFRLNVLPVTMPPLRDHAQDIPDLATHFLKDVARREGKPVKALDHAALAALIRYPWPGNVRELQNICERAAVLTHEEAIASTLIEPWLAPIHGAQCATAAQPLQPAVVRPMDGRLGAAPGSVVEIKSTALAEVATGMGPGRVGANGTDGPTQGADGSPPSLPQIICNGDLTLERIEREVIVKTLEAFHGHRQRSAAALGIGVRTLGLKLKKWKEQRLVAQTL